MSIWNRNTRRAVVRIMVRRLREMGYRRYDYESAAYIGGSPDEVRTLPLPINHKDFHALTVDVHDEAVEKGVFRNKAPRRSYKLWTGGVYHQFKYAFTTQRIDSLTDSQIALQSQMRLAMYEEGWMSMSDIVKMEDDTLERG